MDGREGPPSPSSVQLPESTLGQSGKADSGIELVGGEDSVGHEAAETLPTPAPQEPRAAAVHLPPDLPAPTQFTTFVDTLVLSVSRMHMTASQQAFADVIQRLGGRPGGADDTERTWHKR